MVTFHQAAVARLQPRLTVLLEWVERHRRWFALFGFVAGAASFFLVDRQSRSSALIAVVMLVGWGVLLLEKHMAVLLEGKVDRALPSRMLRTLTQTVHQESLFFVIPFFLASTCWRSPQALITIMLVVSGAIAIVDPVYDRWVASQRWVFLGFHTLVLFFLLLVTLPILFAMPTGDTYLVSAAIALVLAMPSLAGLISGWFGARWHAILAALAIMALALWSLQRWVPPATLRLTSSAVSLHNDGVPLQALTSGNLLKTGVFVQTSIRAPLGLRERIYHEWRHDGVVVDRIPLVISGGRAAGYRTWSHKSSFSSSPEGHWEVKVVTAAGQMIGVVGFDVAR